MTRIRSIKLSIPRPGWLVRWRRASVVAFCISLLIGGPSLSEEHILEPSRNENPAEDHDGILTTPAGVPVTAPFPGLSAPFPGLGVPLRTSTPPPAYLSAPHPFRAEIGDLRQLLRQAGPEELTLAEECANEMESKPTRAEAERKIRDNPVKYHWCFYKMVLGLEETVRSTSGYLERKQALITTFSRLVILAQAYKRVYNDRRYVDFAAEHYRGLNEYLFSRRLVATDDRKRNTGASRLGRTFPGWRPHAEPEPVLGKYGIRPEPFLKSLSRAPASENGLEPGSGESPR